MILRVILTILGAAAVIGQECGYRNDELSPFYWKGYENICTKGMCKTHPWLDCDIPRVDIMEQVYAHFDHDILAEIEYLKKYFDTSIPQPNNQLPYTCKGVCQDGTEMLKLERIFTNITLRNPHTYLEETKRWMCIVIGPDLYYQQCGGNCRMPYGGGKDSYCVPDVTVSVNLWVYCPNAVPSCNKVRFEVPLSCSCKKMGCRKAIPNPAPFIADIPSQPLGWKPKTSIDNRGIPLGPVHPGPI